MRDLKETNCESVFRDHGSELKGMNTIDLIFASCLLSVGLVGVPFL